jgi:hypothetical protein
MAEITIRFRHNRVTGRRELVIHLESDSDVMQHEHEGDHRRLVEKLIGQKLSDDTDVVVERVEKASTNTELAEQASPLPVRQPVSEQG